MQQRNQQLVESYHRLFGLREQLASAEQLASVGQTAANVAHQVGTPLNLISGYVQLLKEELGPGTPHAPRLAIIEEQIAKVTTTVRTLLDRSRPVGRKTRTTAGELVEPRRRSDAAQPRCRAASRSRWTLPAGDTPILVDATNLELALLNLMTNAVDAMPEGGTLRVRVVARRRRIACASRFPTPGTAFPTNCCRASSSRGSAPRSRAAAPASGSPSPVTSSPRTAAPSPCLQRSGGGTTFTIDLPSDAGTRRRPRSLMTAVTASRILVLDDDPGTCRFMQELLAKPDREIETTTDPEQALARVRAKPFDLVISDLKLNARLDGIDVLRAVRERTPGTPVIIVTGFGELEKAVEAVREGAFDFVSKPFNITRAQGPGRASAAQVAGRRRRRRRSATPCRRRCSAARR